MSQTINLTLKVWRQEGPKVKGRIETIAAPDIDTHASFLEMLDIVNERLIGGRFRQRDHFMFGKGRFRLDGFARQHSGLHEVFHADCGRLGMHNIINFGFRFVR